MASSQIEPATTSVASTTSKIRACQSQPPRNGAPSRDRFVTPIPNAIKGHDDDGRCHSDATAARHLGRYPRCPALPADDRSETEHVDALRPLPKSITVLSPTGLCPNRRGRNCENAFRESSR